MSIGIYKFTSKTTGLSYIGQSINIERRYKEHKTEDDGYSFHNAIKKYGWEDFTFEILEECNKEELNEKERYWIAYYNSYKNGYNETPGGEGSPASGKRKAVIQYDLDGNFIAIHNSILDAEKNLGIKPKASNITGVCKGRNYEDHGYQWRYLEDIEDYHKNIGKSLRHEKCREGAYKALAKENITRKIKKVAQCDKETHEIIKVYNSVKEASNETGVYFTSIYKVCNKERKSAGGYYWIDIE